MKKYLSNQKGVTLIELLAVIVILGILAAIAVPAVMSQIDESKTGADEANLVIISDALERALIMGDIEHSDFPITLDTDGTITSSGGTSGDLTSVITPDYLKEVPDIQDSTKTAYTATRTGNKIAVTAN